MVLDNGFQIPSDNDLDTLRIEIINAYDTISLGEPLRFKPLAGSVLRLIFHDCGGPPEGNIDGIISKCDGCIELDNFLDHRDLEFRAIEPMEDIYTGSINNWDEKMSRSDFWAFAANQAIIHTRKEVNDNATLPNIPNYFGRIDCSTSPDLNNTITQHKEFPSAIGGWSETFNWMNNQFGVNADETVALLGAHTIGRLHRDDSGFTGPWVASWGQFNNEYYIRLQEDNLQQRIARNNGLKEWSSNGNGFFTFLNVDIGLFRDLDNHDNIDGSVSCGNDVTTCSLNNEASIIVDRFANNPQDWLDQFVSGYIKMITIGYDIESELIDQSM